MKIAADGAPAMSDVLRSQEEPPLPCFVNSRTGSEDLHRGQVQSILNGVLSSGEKKVAAELVRGEQREAQLPATVPAVTFDKGISAHFTRTTKRADVLAQAAKEGKPIMALVTMSWCHVCMGLKTSVNAGQEVRQLLGSFVVVHAEDTAAPEWESPGESYVPQAYFFDKGGKPLAVQAPNAQFQHYFWDDGTLMTAMKAALALAGGGDGGTTITMASMKIAADGAPAMSDVLRSQEEPPLPCFVNSRTGSEDLHRGQVQSILNGVLSSGEKKVAAELVRGEQREAQLPATVPAVTFDKGISAHFTRTTKRADVLAQAAKEGKPIMALVTMSWCHVCMGLKTSVNAGQEVRQLLGSFVVVHAEDTAAPEWESPGESYVPQAYFFDKGGKPLAVQAPNAQFQHYFWDDGTLMTAMKAALALAGGGDGGTTITMASMKIAAD